MYQEKDSQAFEVETVKIKNIKERERERERERGINNKLRVRGERG